MAPQRQWKRRRPGIWTWLALAWLIGVFAGAIPIAAWFFGVPSPSSHQVRIVQGAMLLASLAPFLPFILLGKLRQDRRLRDEARRAQFAPRFTDPDHERRLDKSRPRVD